MFVFVSFANPLQPNQTKEEKAPVTHEKIQKENKINACVSVTLSCGPTGLVCGSTMDQLIDGVLSAEEMHCNFE